MPVKAQVTASRVRFKVRLIGSDTYKARAHPRMRALIVFEPNEPNNLTLTKMVRN